MRDSYPLGRWAAWIIPLVGLWLIVAPFILQYSDIPRATANDIIVGILVLLLGSAFAFGLFSIPMVGWIIAILGIWEILAPFILGYTGETAALVNDIIVGVIFLLGGVWFALGLRRRATL